MAMISMRKSAAELKQDSPQATDAVGDNAQPVYPWGLQLHLNDEALEKLGLTKLPAVEQGMLLTARVQVVGVSENQTTDSDGVTRSVDLQITDMSLGADPKQKALADRMYSPEAGE